MLEKMKAGKLEDEGKRKAFLDLLLDMHISDPKGLTEYDIQEEVDSFMFAVNHLKYNLISKTPSYSTLRNFKSFDTHKKIHGEISVIEIQFSFSTFGLQCI